MWIYHLHFDVERKIKKRIYFFVTLMRNSQVARKKTEQYMFICLIKSFTCIWHYLSIHLRLVLSVVLLQSFFIHISSHCTSSLNVGLTDVVMGFSAASMQESEKMLRCTQCDLNHYVLRETGTLTCYLDGCRNNSYNVCFACGFS